MNYIQEAQEALAAECPNLDSDLERFYTLLVLVKGDRTTLADVHNAWAMWRNDTNPDHKALVPFSRLTPDAQEFGREYMDAIRRAYRRLVVAAMGRCAKTIDDVLNRH